MLDLLDTCTDNHFEVTLDEARQDEMKKKKGVHEAFFAILGSMTMRLLRHFIAKNKLLTWLPTGIQVKPVFKPVAFRALHFSDQ